MICHWFVIDLLLVPFTNLIKHRRSICKIIRSLQCLKTLLSYNPQTNFYEKNRDSFLHLSLLKIFSSLIQNQKQFQDVDRTEIVETKHLGRFVQEQTFHDSPFNSINFVSNLRLSDPSLDLSSIFFS